MNETTKKVAGILSSAVLLTVGSGAALAVAGEADQAPVEPTATNQVVKATPQPTVKVVAGDFAYTQDEVSSNEAVRKAASASKYFCASQGAPEAAVAAEDWVISVDGAVANPYAMTVAELQDDEGVQKHLMGCSCSGNPADGIASVNAKVTGVSVTTLLKKAGVEAGANTIVFTSADGYEVALPLSYVSTRMCPIVFDVNGSPIAESAGGTNQLWLGSTSARYFARDITGITLEKRQTPPPAPGSDEADDEYANLPNVGVYFGGEIA